MGSPGAVKASGGLSRWAEVSAAVGSSGCPAHVGSAALRGAAWRQCPQQQQQRQQHGVGIQLAGLPGALLPPALPALPPALRSHQAAEELRGQHGRPAAGAPLPAGALGLLPRADPVKEPGRPSVSALEGARECAGEAAWRGGRLIPGLGPRGGRRRGAAAQMDLLSHWVMEQNAVPVKK